MAKPADFFIENHARARGTHAVICRLRVRRQNNRVAQRDSTQHRELGPKCSCACATPSQTSPSAAWYARTPRNSSSPTVPSAWGHTHSKTTDERKSNWCTTPKTGPSAAACAPAPRRDIARRSPSPKRAQTATPAAAVGTTAAAFASAAASATAQQAQGTVAPVSDAERAEALLRDVACVVAPRTPP